MPGVNYETEQLLRTACYPNDCINHLPRGWPRIMMSKYTHNRPRNPPTRRPVAFLQMRSPIMEPPCMRKNRGTRESHSRPMARMVHSWKKPEARNVPSTRPTLPPTLRPGMPPKTRKVWRRSWCQRFAQNSCSDCAAHGLSMTGGQELGEWERRPTANSVIKS